MNQEQIDIVLTARVENRLRILLIRCSMVMVAIVVGLLLAEAVLRMSGLVEVASISTINEEDFRSLPGIFAPGQDVTSKRIPQLTHRITTNSLGYRGADFNLEKGRHEYRIFMTGDSMTFGDFVNDAATLPAQLEQVLRERCQNLTVVNGGLGGATITEEFELIKRAKAIQPDLIILNFYENDIEDLTGKSRWQGLAENRAMKSALPFSVVYPVLQRSAVIGLVHRFRGKLHALSASQTANADENHLHKLRAAYEQKLTELAQYLRTENVRFVFGLYPSHHTFTASASNQPLQAENNYAWALAMAKRMNLPTANMLPPLLKTGKAVNELYFLPHDGHASPEGYGAGARDMAAQLQEREFLPRGSCARR